MHAALRFTTLYEIHSYCSDFYSTIKNLHFVLHLPTLLEICLHRTVRNLHATLHLTALRNLCTLHCFFTALKNLCMLLSSLLYFNLHTGLIFMTEKSAHYALLFTAL